MHVIRAYTDAIGYPGVLLYSESKTEQNFELWKMCFGKVQQMRYDENRQ